MSKTKSFSVKQAISKAKKATKQHKFSDAFQIYGNIFKHYPSQPDAKKALDKLRKKLTSNPKANPTQAQINMLFKPINSGQFVEAEQVCRELLNTFPGSFLLLNSLTCILISQEKFQEAVLSSHVTNQLYPENYQTFHNQATAFKKMGELDNAINSFKKAVKLKPDYSPSNSDLALILLLRGDFKGGWKKHESRNMKEKAKHQVPSSIPKWCGESLEDKIIFVRAEQGVGDEIMFSSCFPDLISRNPKEIIVECDSRLIELFSRSFPEMDIQGKRKEKTLDWLEEFGDISFQVQIGSLPMFFRPSIESFPCRKSFLEPDPILVKKWKKRFDELGEGLKIGISWRGGIGKDLAAIRSIQPELWKPVLQSNAHFVNLQYGDCSKDIYQFKRETGVDIYDWDDADPLTDLDNFAAQISALDLIISVDNSTVHFAGAIGAPVWMLTPESADWRWMLDRDDSPWYSTVRLFRQNINENWSEVFSKIRIELDSYSLLQ